MYIPNHFAENDLNKLHDAIEHYPFATLISRSEDELEASHLPVLLDRGCGVRGTLLCHMAKANLQWRRANGQPVLTIFSGPHSYISPQWYQATEVVPTWNYVAVHAYGRLELIDDAAATKNILDKMVAVFESGQPRPWQMNEPAEFVERLLRQIVAFRIPIDRIEGKWKLNQNRPQEQRERVVVKLRENGDDNSMEVARLMEQDFRL